MECSPSLWTPPIPPVTKRGSDCPGNTEEATASVPDTVVPPSIAAPPDWRAKGKSLRETFILAAGDGRQR